MFAGRLLLTPPKLPADWRATHDDSRRSFAPETTGGASARPAAPEPEPIDVETWDLMPREIQRELMADVRYVVPAVAHSSLGKRKARGTASQSSITQFLKKRP